MSGRAPAPRHPWRQRWWAWAAMGVVVVGVLVVSIDTTPSRGVSDERAYALEIQLKCLQCVGESVAASQAPLAVQFREEIDSQMRQGRTDDEILAFFAQRYGQEVLLTPPSSGLGSLIWIVPIVGFAAAVVALVALFSRWRREVGARATDADRDLVAEEFARRGTAGGSDGLDVGGEGRSDG